LSAPVTYETQKEKMMASHKEPDANAGDASGALAWLARRVGIEPHFVNAMGETVVTPAAVQSALLTAMGLAAADEREAEARLAELDAEECSQPLPPVVVLHAAEQPARIPIALPPQLQPLRWTLAIEAGRRSRASCTTATARMALRCGAWTRLCPAATIA
jgi:hypothetical protein